MGQIDRAHVKRMAKALVAIMFHLIKAKTLHPVSVDIRLLPSSSVCTLMRKTFKCKFHISHQRE